MLSSYYVKFLLYILSFLPQGTPWSNSCNSLFVVDYTEHIEVKIFYIDRVYLFFPVWETRTLSEWGFLLKINWEFPGYARVSDGYLIDR